MKVPNVPERVKYQGGRVREKLEYECDETKLSQFASQLNTRYL